MNWVSFSAKHLNLVKGIGNYLSDNDKAYIKEYVAQNIVKPLGGNDNHAKYIVDLSNIVCFENANSEQPPFVRIIWYSNFAPWSYYAISEWFAFHKPTLELISPLLPREFFWLPESSDKANTANSRAALQNVFSHDPTLATLLNYRKHQFSRYGILSVDEERRLFPEFYS